MRRRRWWESSEMVHFSRFCGLCSCNKGLEHSDILAFSINTLVVLLKLEDCSVLLLFSLYTLCLESFWG